MIAELRALPDPDGGEGYAWDTVELVVPHQANKTMVIELADKAGLVRRPALLQHREGGQHLCGQHPDRHRRRRRRRVIDRPMRIFAPGFGAGSVGGYAVMRIDPAVVVTGQPDGSTPETSAPREDLPTRNPSDDVQVAFGG